MATSARKRPRPAAVAHSLVQRIATSACSSGSQPSPAQNELVYELVWRWITRHLESSIPTGRKALTIRYFVLRSRTLNHSFHEFVTEFVDNNEFVTDIMTLLPLVVMDPCGRTVEFHNRSLLRSEHCVDIVEFLLRFRRTLSPHSATLMAMRRQPPAFISYSRSGHLLVVSKAMVEVIHSGWKQLWKEYCEILEDNTMDHSKRLAIVYWSHARVERKSISLTGSLNRRSASVPLIKDGSNRRGQARRSRSLPREDYY
jgi:hypothetical protein